MNKEKLIKKYTEIIAYNREQYGIGQDVHTDVFDMLYEILPEKIDRDVVRLSFNVSMCKEIEKFSKDLYKTNCSIHWIEVNLRSFLYEFEKEWDLNESKWIERNFNGELEKTIELYEEILSNSRPVIGSRNRIKEEKETWVTH